MTTSHKSMNPSALGEEIDGRIYNDQSDLYKLPADNDEFRRLNKQHHALKLALGGLYPCSELVNVILDPSVNPQPKILDLGCGSGIWAREMAQKYPHASVVGVDLAPVQESESIPSNCHFKVHDINNGLKDSFSDFDVIVARCIGGGIKNFAAMMQESAACLKPGGWIMWMDGDMRLYAEDKIHPIPLGLDLEEGGNPMAGSWTARMARETRYAAVDNGSDIDGMEHSLDYGAWGHPLLDQTTVQAASLFTPLGAWATSSDSNESDRVQLIGTLVGQDFSRLASAWQRWLSQQGIPQDRLAKWVKRAEEELENGRFRMYMRWRLTWGRRTVDREEIGQEFEPRIMKDTQPGVAMSTANGALHPKDCSWYTVYSTKEDAANAADIRKEAAKSLPTPLVTILQEKRSRED